MVMVTVWWSAAHLSITTFWIPVKPSHLRSMFKKSMRCSENCNACSQHWSTERAQIFSRTMTTHFTPTLQKLNKLGYEVLPQPSYSPDLSPNDNHFFKHLSNFLQGKCFRNQQEAENAFQEFLESWSTDFHATEINILIVVGQNVLFVMVPILINKYVSELSYNDLNFTVWYHNYICTKRFKLELLYNYCLLLLLSHFSRVRLCATP